MQLHRGHELTVGVRWRRFQQMALADLFRAHDGGSKRLHLVAPPGAGKTLMGLEVALRSGRSIVALSHTTAVQAQWAERFLEHVVDPTGQHRDLRGAVGGTMPAPDAPVPMMLSLTYQALTRVDPERAADAEGWQRLADEPRAFMERIGPHAPIIILDECHHLRRWWAEAIGAWLARFADITVLGLTATPPADAPSTERDRFETLVGDVDHEIPLVAAVREGLVAPFVDLAHFVRPTADEERYVEGLEAALDAWLHGAEASWQAEDGRRVPGLTEHVRARCERPVRGAKTFTDFIALLDDEPAFALALVRWLRHRGDEPPAGVYPTPEMGWPLSREDVLLVVGDYCEAHLPPDEAGATRRQRDALAEALGPLGVQVRRDGLRRSTSAAADRLSRSAAKAGGAVDVLTREWQLRGSELCAAVVTDFETTAAGGTRRDADDPAVAGAIGAFRAIAAAPALAGLLPMLITGQRRWLPEPLLGALADRLGAQADRLIVSTDDAPAGFVTVGLTGDARGGLVRAMTSLLERDHSHCVVGTRGILGEGWDCRSLDTLIDLTHAGAHVAVNQLRGRVLRRDPDRPEKVAHIWDIVAVPRGLASGAALADIERMQAKHDRYFAAAPDGALERGAGHVHPTLRAPAAKIARHAEAIDAALAQLIDARPEGRARWRLGEPMLEEERTELRAIWRDRPTTQRSDQAARQNEAPAERDETDAASLACLSAMPLPTEATETVELAHQRWRQSAIGAARAAAAFGVAVVGGGVLIAAAPTAPVVWSVLLAAAGAAGFGVWKLTQQEAASQALGEATGRPADRVWAEKLVRVFRAAIQDAAAPGLQQVGLVLDGGERGVSVHLVGGKAHNRERAADGLCELFEGTAAPVYALRVERVALPPVPLLARIRGEVPERAFEAAGLVPLPVSTGTGRKLALAWAAAWRAHIGPATLVAVRRDRIHEDAPFADPVASAWLRTGDAEVDRRHLIT